MNEHEKNETTVVSELTMFDAAGHLDELREKIEHWLLWRFDEACGSIENNNPLIQEVNLCINIDQRWRLFLLI